MPPGFLDRINLFTTQKFILQNTTDRPLFVLVTSDPNAMQLGKLDASGGIGSQQVNASVSLVWVKKSPAAQKMVVHPGSSSNVLMDSSAAYLTTAVQSSQNPGYFRVIWHNRRVISQSTVQFQLKHLQTPLGLMKGSFL